MTQAELSNLCIQNVQEATFLRNRMNQAYRQFNLTGYKNFLDKVLAPDEAQKVKTMRDSLDVLDRCFLVQDQDKVKDVRTQVMEIFDILGLSFPSLRIE